MIRRQSLLSKPLNARAFSCVCWRTPCDSKYYLTRISYDGYYHAYCLLECGRTLRDSNYYRKCYANHNYYHRPLNAPAFGFVCWRSPGDGNYHCTRVLFDDYYHTHLLRTICTRVHVGWCIARWCSCEALCLYPCARCKQCLYDWQLSKR